MSTLLPLVDGLVEDADDAGLGRLPIRRRHALAEQLEDGEVVGELVPATQVLKQMLLRQNKSILESSDLTRSASKFFTTGKSEHSPKENLCPETETKRNWANHAINVKDISFILTLLSH